MPSLRRRPTCSHAPRPGKDVYNPFPELSQSSCYERQPKKSPKNSKKVGKCFQLMLICQKLLKPFNSSSKMAKRDVIIKEKSCDENIKFNREVNNSNSFILEKAASSLRKRDEYVEANEESVMPIICQGVLEGDYVTIRECEDFPCVSEKLLQDQYWDLDIDSAIVGDCDSLSALSLDEEIDPHYATIEIALDGRVIDKVPHGAEEVLYTSVYPDNQASCANSSNSSPKSGIYSKIIKPRKNDNFGSLKMDFYHSYTSSRLNFEKMIASKKRTGLSCDLGHYCSRPDQDLCIGDYANCSGTPDIPSRNYGPSVVNYITELRHGAPYRHSCTNVAFGKGLPVMPIGAPLARSHIYCPIWISECRTHTPASEPTAQRRSVDKVLHQLNPAYHDDSSGGASSISINSPSRKTYSYPQHFSESVPRRSARGVDASTLTEAVGLFRHVDSELDLSLVFPGRERRVETVTTVSVPLDGGEGDLRQLYEESACLQPLMERSCEEDCLRESFYRHL